ncbi:MAG: molybdopterin molybdenumtransferase MoeA, partial [Alphaproteobacteria bacterium]|nr:molybdopterin molybdenumtransferase MoeA [Alphaproteobacteria bacterium]
MAQLSDDCFAFGGALLSVDDALARIEERITRVVDIATTPLGCARGRVLARDVVSSMNLPPHANSAVDGYAFAHADLVPGAETVLPVSGRAAAGHPLGQPAQRGAAVRIFTGAPMPDGTDTVMMQEDCVVEGGRVHLKPGIRKGANRRHAGEDVAEGAVALAAGRRLAPADL